MAEALSFETPAGIAGRCRLMGESTSREGRLWLIGQATASTAKMEPRSATAGLFYDRRSVPLTTISTRRDPHPPQTSRACQSGTGISAP